MVGGLKALIFDVDGTLAETEEAHRAAFNTCFEKWGLEWFWSRDSYRKLLKTTGGKERIVAFQEWEEAGQIRLHKDEIARLHKEKTQAYIDILERGELELRPGVAELIMAARRAGLKLAIATTTNTPNVEALSQCCWQKSAASIFDAIAAGDEVLSKKPAADVYELALERLGLESSSCLAFEDSLNGVKSAQGAGLRVIVTASAYTDREDFSVADWLLPDLGRQYLPKELLAAL